MAEYRLKGEDFLTALALAKADAREFQGVVVYRFWGTQPDIKAATAALESVYPENEKTTLGDAEWLGTIRTDVETGEKPVYVDLYELIVMRKV